jgi:hypothetical protein
MHIPAGQFKPWQASPVAGQVLVLFFVSLWDFKISLGQVEFYQYRRYLFFVLIPLVYF